MRIAIVLIAAFAMGTSFYYMQYEGGTFGFLAMWTIALIIAILQDIKELIK